MKNIWMMEELIESFTLLPEELHMVLSKSKDARLGFAILFKYFQNECKFPEHKSQFPKQVIQYIAKQIETQECMLENYNLNGRSVRHHKVQIRNYFGFRLPNNDDSEKVTKWLLALIDFNRANRDSLKEHVFAYFRKKRIEPSSNERIEKIISSVLNTFENRFFNNTFKKLSSESLDGIDTLIRGLSDENNEENLFNELRSDPGRLGLETIFLEIKKLRTIRNLNIPDTIFDNIPKKVLKKYKQRVGSEDIRELRRHPEPIRYTLLSIFFWLRSREITDNLIELLIQVIHKIKVRAERRIDKEFINDFKRANGKTNILYKMAELALANPDEKVKDAIFPIITEKTLNDLVKEYRHSGSAYNKKVHTVMRASYGRHYRRMIPQLLHILEFKSNNEIHRPVMEALELIKRYAHTSLHHFPANEYVPIEGVIRAKWKDSIVEVDNRGRSRINRINYEIFTLQSLRDKLRCKEIWVLGADRYRNPDQDLPADFEINRKENYKALNKPLDARNLISHLQNKMINSLDSLNKDITKNPKVRITTKGNGWISISPSEPQAESQNLIKLKSQIASKWPMTNLLDVLKETDLQLSFTDNFKTMGVREQLNRRIIQKRLILALYGLGTNTSLKRVASGNHGEKYKDLFVYTKKIH
ncbi:DUF4158 domain-containing protein [Paramaledivibacter caminithermalis]|uniref:Tn3 transposase DDE domain-containing protein n=1 Tax=Paramaledivibacter caminithermalis (strain DSM 15212 / CIP 107654 / DViRD3) TaxID=1121301 RepID=A0A1M6KJ86_PARC5|nr:Tn3 transposase DDE domain-containing protein [Paramaledivibacter caminithermalis DSM 15212]